MAPLEENSHPASRHLDPPPFYFIVTFWGSRYRDWFCRFTLASLLSPNNIPALKNRRGNQFLFCTTGDDWAALQNEPNFCLLKQYVHPIFLEIPSVSEREHKYVRMSLAHEMLTQRCFEAKAIAIYLACETLIPDGCIAEAQRLVEQDYKVVLCTAIRFELEGVQDELLKRGLMKVNEPITISRREAVEIGLNNLHSESRAGEWAASYFGDLNPAHGRNHFPTCCFWRVEGQNGVCIVTHNWAPFVINFACMTHHNTDAFRKWAIDGDYVHLNFRNQKLGEDICIIEDSDSIVLIGLTPRDEMAVEPQEHWWQTIPVAGEWSKGFILNQAVFDKYTDPLRRLAYSKLVRWHAHDFTDAWKAVEDRARQIMDEYMRNDLSSMRVLTGLVSRGRQNRLLEIARMIWTIYIFAVHAPISQPITFWPRTAAYSRVILRAVCGDRKEIARIRRRMEIICAQVPILRWVPRILSYGPVIFRAICGDRTEIARIRRRLRIIRTNVPIWRRVQTNLNGRMDKTRDNSSRRRPGSQGIVKTTRRNEGAHLRSKD
jgi:hypothetical protein